MLNIKLKYKRKGAYTEDRKKRTENKKIIDAPLSNIMIYPLSMHIGRPAKPIVSVGDYVKRGQIIAEKEGFISANIHASVSGVVEDIKKSPTVSGLDDAIIIKNDFKDTPAPLLKEGMGDLTKDDKLFIIEQAGIVGMGGATFPTDVKLLPEKEKTLDTLIVNGAECEPYSTSDHRLMYEYADELISGIKEILSIIDLEHTYIAIESNEHDSVKILKRAIGKDKRIKIKELETIYPQGSEKGLIRTVSKREIPTGGLPIDVHTLVLNVSTVRAIYTAIHKGLPMMERITTVSGETIKDPQNFHVKIGTPIQVLIDACGGFTGKTGKMLHGGPMMGKTMTSGQIPVGKGTTAISFLPLKDVQDTERTPCIRCAECLNVCPINLQPVLISEAYENGNIKGAEKLGALDCIDCGNCSFICPSRIPLLDNIKKAKVEIIARREKNNE